jgi:hypothetical protein
MLTKIGKWEKLGLIIKPQKQLWWMQTHAMVPTVDWLDGSLCRIYFSGRDKENRSHIGYAVMEINSSYKILEYSSEPVLTLGNLGCFDDNGVTPSSIVDYAGRKYLYYIGWNKRSTVRMSLVAGLAVSNDGGKSFERYSRAPVLERTNEEPYSILTAPYVIIGKGVWRMWYVSGIGWVNPDLPRYNIKYAESRDGIHWERNGTVCIDLKSETENALARPCVIKDSNLYKMWFAHKGKEYRLGYAESKDGLKWERKDAEAGIDTSESGWDSEMMEYAFVFRHNNRKYMLYNGNNYGFDGIGLAVEK